MAFYIGPIWDGRAVNFNLWELLSQTDTLIELTSGSPAWQVTLGAPHHAAPGAGTIAERWVDPERGIAGRPADESVGLLGLAVFSVLQELKISCRLVIAAHFTDNDPNKTPGSPYWESIFSSSRPALILELHGAGNTRRHHLELSAGRNQLARPLEFGRLVASRLDPPYRFCAQEKPGSKHGWELTGGQETPCKLENPALKTDLLAYAGELGIPALHLEVKPVFRHPDKNHPESIRPTPACWQLAKAISLAFKAES